MTHFNIVKIEDVLFVAGDVNRLASIKIRCRDIAERLNARCFYGAHNPRQVPSGFKAYICVKPTFGPEGAEDLAKKGAVIWDILDDHPPATRMTAYIASTYGAAKIFDHLGSVAVIHHHHCNIEGGGCCGDSSKVGYVGSSHWYPRLDKIKHLVYRIDGWERAEVASAYRQLGIAVNLRNLSGTFSNFLTSPHDVVPITDLHVKINSGMKLINCLGFGLPSISANEPAYHEIAPECTIFSDLHTYDKALDLLCDPCVYNRMRARCLEIAPKYHLSEIVKKYRMLIEAL